jgi:DNA-binding transcriptional LysR family regulator
MSAFANSQEGDQQRSSFAPHGHIPVRELEVAELRAFVAAATLGSIAEAARAMNISQPAMSKKLKALESVAGAELFERSTRGVRLTPAGVQLYSAARKLLHSADSVQALIANPGPAMPVRIASTPTVAELRLPQVLSQIAQIEHSLTAELISANSVLVRELVSEGRCDLGIVTVDPHRQLDDELEERVVWRDELVLIVPPGHPWAEFEDVPVEEFARTPVVQRDPWSNSSRLVTTMLERAGLERVEPTTAIGSTAAVIATALATQTPALLSIMAAKAQPAMQFEIRRVEGLRFGLEFALVWSGAMMDLRPTVQTVAGHILDLPFARAKRDT